MMHAHDYVTCTDAKSHLETGRQILLLEQDEFVASLIHLLLHREGFMVRAYTGTEHAMSHIRNQSPPDLIFVSSNWLEGSKPEIFNAIDQRIEWQRVPMVMLMNYFSPELIEKGLDLGVTDYLLQPFEPAELIDLIRKYF